jgi:hypothetical protein
LNRIVNFLSQGRVAVFITTFLMTLLLYTLRGIGWLTIVPGWVFLLLFTGTFIIFLLALQGRRQVW